MPVYVSVGLNADYDFPDFPIALRQRSDLGFACVRRFARRLMDVAQEVSSRRSASLRVRRADCSDLVDHSYSRSDRGTAHVPSVSRADAGCSRVAAALENRYGPAARPPMQIIVLCTVGTYQRAEVWNNPLSFWTDAAAKSPTKARPHFQFAYALYETGRCDLASAEYDRTSKLQPMSYELAVDWGIALDCANRSIEAVVKLDQAAAIEKSAHAHAEKGRILLKMARSQEARFEFDMAETIDPRFEYTYIYRAGMYENNGNFPGAVEQYKKALALNPANTLALEGMKRAAFGVGARR